MSRITDTTIKHINPIWGKKKEEIYWYINTSIYVVDAAKYLRLLRWVAMKHFKKEFFAG